MIKNNFTTNSIYVSVTHTEKLIKKYVKVMSKIFKKISRKNEIFNYSRSEVRFIETSK